MLEIEQFDNFTVCIYKIYLQIVNLEFMYKEDLALKNQEWLICHENKPNQTKSFATYLFSP